MSALPFTSPSTFTSNAPPAGYFRYQTSSRLARVPMGAVSGAVSTQVRAPLCLLCATIMACPYQGSIAGVGCVVTVYAVHALSS